MPYQQEKVIDDLLFFAMTIIVPVIEIPEKWD